MPHILHSATALFPKMTDGELKALAESIKEHRQQDFIVLWNGQVVDGRMLA